MNWDKWHLLKVLYENGKAVRTRIDGVLVLLALLLLAPPLAAQTPIDTVRGKVGDSLAFWFSRATPGCTRVAQMPMSTNLFLDRLVGCWDSVATPKPPAPPPPPVDTVRPPPPPPPPADTVIPPPPPVDSGFKAPDILNNLSFESGWDGMTSWAFSTPTTVRRDCAKGYVGSCSVTRTLPVTNGQPTGDMGAQFVYGFYYRPPAKQFDRLWARWSFYLDKPVDGVLKFNIWEGQGFAPQFGGLYFFSGNLAWWYTEYATAGISGHNRIASLSSLVGAWHTVEVEYWRNGHPSGYPAARIWLDGVMVTNASTPAPSRYDNGYILAGRRDSNARLGTFNLIGTLNGQPRNNIAGNIWIDKVSLSSVGRIGP